MSMMELVAEVANCFLFLQNASSYMFGRVLNAPLNWRKVFKNLLGWSHWLGICRSKECHKSFKLINISNVYHTEESLELQEVNIVDIQDRQRPLHVLYIIPRSLKSVRDSKKVSHKYVSQKPQKFWNHKLSWRFCHS